MAAPTAVRFGRSRGRSSRWCISLSPVQRRSMDGHSEADGEDDPGEDDGGEEDLEGDGVPGAGELPATA